MVLLMSRRIRYSSIKQRGDAKKWLGKLAGYPVFILGNGPSLNDESIASLFNYFTIGINRSFYKLDSTILMWQDPSLWYTEKNVLCKTKSIKYCTPHSDPQNLYYHFKVLPGGFGLPDNPINLKGGGTTLPLAVQLAYILGCNPIVLLGCDCKPRGQDTDFYGNNKFHHPKTMLQCNSGLLWVKSIHDKGIVKIISCSDNEFFPRVSLDSVISSLDVKHKQSREYWNQLLL